MDEVLHWFCAFNDRNGYHSQKGLQGTSLITSMLIGSFINQLSFGLSLTAVQNQVDQTQLSPDEVFAPIVQSDSYFNADFSVAYHRDGLSSYFTVKNLFLAAKNNLNNNLEPLDLRNYILSFGYYLVVIV